MWIIILWILGNSSEYQFPIVWHGIRITALIGLQMISAVADGAPSNRRLFQMQELL